MAISFIGSANGTNTATMPAHVAGDLIVVAAWRLGAATVPTAPGGWTNIILNQGSGTIGGNVRWKIAASSGETVGTWTNADLLVVHVYRGAAGIGTNNSSANTSTNATYSALTLQNNLSSWVMTLGAVSNTGSTVENPRSNVSVRQAVVGATGEISSFDTNGPYVGTWGLSNVGLGSSLFYTTVSLEIVESPRAVTAQAGSYTLSGADTPIIRPSPISFVGAATGTNTATVPAHVAGDLIVVAAWNGASTTAPGLPGGGWTSITNGAGSTTAYRYLWKLAASSAETVPTITNATICAVAVYRGTRQASPIGGGGTGSGTSTNILYQSASFTDTSGGSWLVAFGFVKSTVSSIETPPPPTTLRINTIDATSEVVVFDSDGGTTTWGAKFVPLGSSLEYASRTIEIRAPVNTNMTADPGSYMLTGADTNIARSYTISANPGSYMLSGADTPFIRALFMSAAPGAYTINGADTTMDVGRFIYADPGSYALTGADTPFVRALVVAADPGAYALTGANTSIARSLIMSGSPGSYALTGADSLFQRGFVVSAAPGSYSLSGANTAFIRAMTMSAAPGAYLLSGADTPIYTARLMSADAGSYSINGEDVTWELTVTSIRLKRYVGGVWETNRLKMYRDGEWIKPPLKRYVSGVWVLVND